MSFHHDPKQWLFQTQKENSYSGTAIFVKETTMYTIEQMMAIVEREYIGKEEEL